MVPFVELRGIPAAIPRPNIDTDQIIPKQFLKTITRSGLGEGLFHELRVTPDGAARADFVLNRVPWTRASILVAGENFGCGSSREHAPWALLDFGIRCVIAPSFADIFYNNCLNNGLLPISLAATMVAKLRDAAANPDAMFDIDLPNQMVTSNSGIACRFEIEAFAKRKLLNGLDAIGETLHHGGAIDVFEARRLGRGDIL